jgi:hypothetical protein
MALTKPRFGQIDTTITAINDAVTILNAASDSANVDVGFIVNRSFNTVPNVAIYWSEAGNAFTTSWTTASGYTSGNIDSIGLANLAIGHMTVTGHIVPTTNVTYDLGSATNRFRTLYISGNTIDFGGATITANSQAFSFNTDSAGSLFTVESQVGGSLANFDKVVITDTTVSTSTTTGALIVTGGIGSSGNVVAVNLIGQDFRYSNGVSLISTISSAVDNAIANTPAISEINANVTAANAAIITANTGMKSYVDGQISTVSSAITTANTNLKSYVDDRDAVLTSNAATQASAITTLDANLGAVTNNITTLFSNAATQATSLNSVNANVGAYQIWANARIQTLDANLGTATTNITTLFSNAAGQANQITGANTAIVTANTGMKSYVDGQITSVNNSITTANNAVVSYVNTLNSAMVANITAANTAIITNAYSNAKVASYLPVYSGSIGGTLTTVSQPNITSLGTLNSLSVTGNVVVGGVLQVNGSLSMSANKITDLGTPTNSTDATNKQYVDEVAAGLKAAPAVEAATTTNLTATYNNGTSGVGATLTATSNGAFPAIDGITVATTTPGQNGILVKNQSTAAHNGRYNLTQVGNAGTPWILTRCAVCDQASEIPGSYVFVKAGTTQSSTGWVAYVSSPSSFVVGTDSITYFQFSGAGTYTAGTGLTLTGTQFSVNASQTQITGLGTIATGTWAATDVGLAHGGTNASLTAVNGGVVYSTASALAIGSAGTSGQILTSAGAAAPTWTNQNTLAVNTAATWATARTLTIGSTGKSVNGSANVSWSLAEIGADNASNLVTGTLPDARLTGTYTNFTHRLDGSNTIFTLPSPGSTNTAARTVYGLAEYRSSASAQVGAIVIIAPNTTSTVMHQFEIQGLLYNQNIVRLTVQGYRTTGAWSDLRKISFGTVDVQTRWGVTPDGKNCLILGDVGTSWSYPHFSVVRAMFSHTNANDGYSSGWTVAVVTDLSTYTNVSADIPDSTLVGSVSGSAASLTTARAINGTNFNGTAAITTANWGTARTINGVSVNGSTNYTLEPYVERDDTTNATRYLTFVDDATAAHKRLNMDIDLSYNPNTNVLSTTATSARYADLAEKYTSDLVYVAGTVVVFGGTAEITISTVSHDTRIAGVISTNPAYLMNSTSAGLPVALTGRIPCQVQGPVNKGTVLVSSSIPGVAMALDNSRYVPGCVIGKALEAIATDEIKTIEVVVGRF